MTRWQRAVPVAGPILTGPFLMFAAMAALALGLSVYREFAGLGAVTSLNDGYSWGLFKNLNVTTLTALGSGGYAVGMLAWLVNDRRFHVLMRTAVLTSLLSYGTGMLALTVDIGRPWNLFYIANPKIWNHHSLLLEVALCMSAYVLLSLDMENIPALLERLRYGAYSERTRARAEGVYRLVRRIYPFIIALAFILPSMHQSTLGSLMMLSGPRVHPLWQTPMLPLFYLIMAYILGLCCVLGVLMISCLVWARPLDMAILSKLACITSWIALGFVGLRILDIDFRGHMSAVFAFDQFSCLFWKELGLIAGPALALRVARWRNDPRILFQLLIVLALGGILYRFAPTTLAFLPGGQYIYFPSVNEVVMSAGFIALAICGYIVAVKRLAILPASVPVETSNDVQRSASCLDTPAQSAAEGGALTDGREVAV